ncbi:MAG: CHASE2 domain-containing protein, partial [Chitinophagaceae bacterium]
MIKYLFKRDTILATIMVFVVMALLALIPINTHVLDPIKLAMQDFDYNDLAYSELGKNQDRSVDTNIVIVNIADADRGGIAALINNIAGKKPAAIGVDVLFNAPKEAAADSMLAQTFAAYNNIVLAYNLQKEKNAVTATGFLVRQARAKGYANFVGEEGGSIRHTAPVIKKKDETYQSFAASVAQVAYPQAYNKLMQRNNSTEQVNYTRRADKFLVVEGQDVLTDSSAMLAGKTVLLGF